MSPIYLKVYFWIFGSLTLTTIATFIFFLTVDGLGSIETSDFFWLASSALGLLGLYGFTFKKLMFSQSFWLLAVTAILIFDIGYESYSFIFGLYIEPMATTEVAILCAVVLFAIPYYICLIKYAFSNKIWAAT